MDVQRTAHLMRYAKTRPSRKRRKVSIQRLHQSPKPDGLSRPCSIFDTTVLPVPDYTNLSEISGQPVSHAADSVRAAGRLIDWAHA